MILRGMKKLPPIILLLIFGLTPYLSGTVKLTVRNKAYLTVGDFKRIPEFFTGKEYEGSNVYCRSDTKEREGFYFVVKVSGSVVKISPTAHWKLDWFSPLNPEAQTKKIPINNPDFFGKEVFIGLTGQDWPDHAVQPLAWRICLMNNTKEIIAESQSFLWSK